jgi:hypothetical protein
MMGSGKGSFQNPEKNHPTRKNKKRAEYNAEYSDQEVLAVCKREPCPDVSVVPDKKYLREKNQKKEKPIEY